MTFEEFKEAYFAIREVKEANSHIEDELRKRYEGFLREGKANMFGCPDWKWKRDDRCFSILCEVCWLDAINNYLENNDNDFWRV